MEIKKSKQSIWKRLAMAIIAVVVATPLALGQNSLGMPGQGSNPGPVMGGSSSLPAPGSGSNPGPVVGGSTSVAAPGTGGSYQPNVGQNGIGWNPTPWYRNHWGTPWYAGWNYLPTTVTPVAGSFIPDSGITRVIACGYDGQGVWQVIPLVVSYKYTGVQYKVVVISAWDPWADMWDKNIDQPAFNTAYYLKGVTYAFYVPLSTGTYYFNL